MLVESVPVETSLDLPELPQAVDVWQAMIAAARETLRVASFYFSDDPGDPTDPLDRVLADLHAAAARGVHVALLGDAGFARTYPDIPQAVAGWPNSSVTLLDARRLWGGVHHAKYLVVDDRELYVGSQNWDWRALVQIRELGARLQCPPLARCLAAIFDTDTALAHGRPVPHPAGLAPGPWTLDTPYGGPVTVTLAASPPQALPTGIAHDLPLLTALIDRARHDLCLQLLSYAPVGHDGTFAPLLDDALRRAAARGVRVRIVLADWAASPRRLPYIQSLAVLPGVAVKFSHIPPWSGGFVPYARVEHCKYLVKDDDEAWLGTANWAPDYFTSGRNVSLFLRGAAVAAELQRFFTRTWDGPYTETVDPCGQYRPPRRDRP